MSAPNEGLQYVAEELQRRGFLVRRRSFFAPDGLMVARMETVHAPPPHDSIQVLENGVFLHPVGSGWEARTTQHGGPHWVAKASTPAELLELALAALDTPERPLPGWSPVADGA